MPSKVDETSHYEFFQDETSHYEFLQDEPTQPITPAVLILLNPTLLELIRRSDQHQFLSRYMTMLDESYIALLEKYPPEQLALPLCIIMHENRFPAHATTYFFQLRMSFEEHDTLCIITKPDCLPYDAVKELEEHRAALREFFLDPVRSRHHNFRRSAGRMYARSLLACFSFLDTQLFRYDHCPHCFLDGLQLIPYNTLQTEKELNVIFHNQETQDTMGSKSEGQYNPRDSDIADTEKDIKAWSENWHQVVSKENAHPQNCPSCGICKK